MGRSAALDRNVKPTMRTVWPSAGARATTSVPMIVLAPGRFSTTTLWPSALLSGCDSARATTSFDPPAGNGTTSRTTLDGKGCAAAVRRSMRPTGPAPQSRAHVLPSSPFLLFVRAVAVQPSIALPGGPGRLILRTDSIASHPHARRNCYGNACVPSLVTQAPRLTCCRSLRWARKGEADGSPCKAREGCQGAAKQTARPQGTREESSGDPGA